MGLTLRDRAAKSALRSSPCTEGWIDREIGECEFRDARLGDRFRKLLGQIGIPRGSGIFLAATSANGSRAVRHSLRCNRRGTTWLQHSRCAMTSRISAESCPSMKPSCKRRPTTLDTSCTRNRSPCYGPGMRRTSRSLCSSLTARDSRSRCAARGIRFSGRPRSRAA
jgi:hypothetical protein